MNVYIKIFLIILTCSQLQAQNRDSLNQSPSPIGGVNSLALKYFGIEFSKEQKELLKDKEIELVYLISEQGEAILSEVNGINDPSIIDSLKQKKVNKFNPSISNGIPIESIYFIRLTFPTYKLIDTKFNFQQSYVYKEAKLEDFEYLHESGQRLDMVVGGFTNQFIGKPGKHLGLGGGIKIDINYSGKNKMIYGLNMSFAENKLILDYPINSTREQISPVSGFIGLNVGKWFYNFNVQSNLSLTVHNITEKLGENDPDWVQLNGWSPGVILNYPIQIGDMIPMYYYGAPSLIGNHINFSLGFRYVKYPLNEATGLMVQIGISYRMSVKSIKEYKFKDEFLN